MHLRLGVFYRSGNPVARENVSRISTEESTVRTPGLGVQQAKENLQDMSQFQAWIPLTLINPSKLESNSTMI